MNAVICKTQDFLNLEQINITSFVLKKGKLNLDIILEIWWLVGSNPAFLMHNVDLYFKFKDKLIVLFIILIARMPKNI